MMHFISVLLRSVVPSKATVSPWDTCSDTPCRAHGAVARLQVVDRQLKHRVHLRTPSAATCQGLRPGSVSVQAHDAFEKRMIARMMCRS